MRSDDQTSARKVPPNPDLSLGSPLGAHQPTHTKVIVAVDALREAIMEGRMKGGDRLIVSELAAALAMSPTPVREALRLLEAEGLVENKPHRGAVVADLSAIDADTVYLLRAPMEALATRLAVPRLTPEQIEELENLHRELKAAYKAGDDGRLTAANARWHMLIYEACGSPYVIDLIRRLWMPFHWSGKWVPPIRGKAVEEHGRIMRAVRAGDSEAAGRLMQDHIERVHRTMVADSNRFGRDGSSTG